MRRITKAALGGLAGCALVLGGVQAASGESLFKQFFSGNLVDLETDDEGPNGPVTGAFDSAQASLKVVDTSGGGTVFSIRVKNIDLSFAGRTFGSHLHTATCQENGSSTSVTGGHYQHPDPELTTIPQKEVWFELVPNEEGVAVDRTVVPFVPKDEGVMSIVIHEDPTNPTTGVAGDKEVCLPLDVTTTFPDIEPSPVIETP